jgi:hypothetical protein
MTDYEKLEGKIDGVGKDVSEIKGALGVLSTKIGFTSAEVKKVEGRQWGLVIMCVGAFGTALLSLLLSRSEKVAGVVNAVVSLLNQ